MGSAFVWSTLCLFHSSIKVIMAQVDRWTLKILSLPLFSDAFAQAIAKTPLANLAFVSAMGVSSAAEFSAKVAEWAGSFEPAVAQVLLKDSGQLENFWSLAIRAEKMFFESTAFQLGFGLCDNRPPETRGSPLDQLRQAVGVRALLSGPKAPNKKLKGLAQASDSLTPLLDQENNEKAKWAARLEAIGQRAGPAAKLLVQQEQSDELSPSELSRLRQIVLLSGAPRTVSAHVRASEKFEHWATASSVVLYPLTVDKILKYCLVLDQRECGPSVVPAFKTSVKWVASRLAIDLPDVDDQRLKAIQDQIVSSRATTLKEAVPIPIAAVCSMEAIVVNPKEFAQARIFVWWLLCMVFASLRFDDAIHVKPSELVMQDEGLFGVAWQTKVERKRSGTRFMVPKVGFRHNDWLETGWSLFKLLEVQDRDFWMFELNSKSEFDQHPPSHQRTVTWLRCFAHQGVMLDRELPATERKGLIETVDKLTVHSCRVTLLDAAVHAGRSTEEIGLQANWKNPGPMVLKYTRNRSSVPATMIKQLVREMVQENHPVIEDAQTFLTDASDQDLDNLEFFIKNPGAGTYYDYKFHAPSIDDSTQTACRRFAIDECQSVGDILPDLSVLCKACSKARPEIACFFSKS